MVVVGLSWNKAAIERPVVAALLENNEKRLRNQRYILFAAVAKIM